VAWSSDTYPFAAWTSATGNLVLETTSFSYDQTSVIARITTKNTIKTLVDEFKITFKDQCRDDPNQITLKSSVKETYTYNIPASSTPLVINPINPSGTNTIKHQGCPVTCILEKLDSTNNWNTLASTS